VVDERSTTVVVAEDVLSSQKGEELVVIKPAHSGLTQTLTVHERLRLTNATDLCALILSEELHSLVLDVCTRGTLERLMGHNFKLLN